MTTFRGFTKIVGLTAAVALALPAMADTVVTTTDSGKHHYVYYSNHDIYFAPETRTYYWMDNGAWRSGSELPVEQRGYITSKGVDIDLDTVRPYERNEYVVSHYGNSPTTQSTTTERSTSMDGSTTTTTTTTTHKYVYYGDHDIYFSPETKTYFWRSNGAWQSGSALPAEAEPYVRSGGVAIELDTARPYEREDYVIAHYGHRHEPDRN